MDDAKTVLENIEVLENKQISNGLEFGYLTLAEILIATGGFEENGRNPGSDPTSAGL